LRILTLIIILVAATIAAINSDTTINYYLSKYNIQISNIYISPWRISADKITTKSIEATGIKIIDFIGPAIESVEIDEIKITSQGNKSSQTKKFSPIPIIINNLNISEIQINDRVISELNGNINLTLSGPSKISAKIDNKDSSIYFNAAEDTISASYDRTNIDLSGAMLMTGEFKVTHPSRIVSGKWNIKNGTIWISSTDPKTKVAVNIGVKLNASKTILAKSTISYLSNDYKISGSLGDHPKIHISNGTSDLIIEKDEETAAISGYISATINNKDIKTSVSGTLKMNDKVLAMTGETISKIKWEAAGSLGEYKLHIKHKYGYLNLPIERNPTITGEILKHHVEIAIDTASKKAIIDISGEAEIKGIISEKMIRLNGKYHGHTLNAEGDINKLSINGDWVDRTTITRSANGVSISPTEFEIESFKGQFSGTDIEGTSFSFSIRAKSETTINIWDREMTINTDRVNVGINLSSVDNQVSALIKLKGENLVIKDDTTARSINANIWGIEIIKDGPKLKVTANAMVGENTISAKVMANYPGIIPSKIKETLAVANADILVGISGLSDIRKYFPQVAKLDAKAVAILHIDNLMNPMVSGKIQVIKAALDIPKRGISLTAAGGGSIVNNIATIKVDVVDSDGGTASIMANGDIFNLSPGIVLDKFKVSNAPNKSLRVNGETVVENDNGKIIVYGNLDMSGEVALSNKKKRTTKDIYNKKEEHLSPIGLKIYNKINDVSLDINGGKLMAEGSVYVFGDINKTLAKGTLRLTGSVKFKSLELEVTEGKVIFDGPSGNPTINIILTKIVDKIEVGVRVFGSGNNISTKLYSDQNLSDLDILSYIALGHPSSGSAADLTVILDVMGMLFGGGDPQIVNNLKKVLMVDDIYVNSKDGTVGIGATKKISDLLSLEVNASSLETSFGANITLTKSIQCFVKQVVGEYSAVGLKYNKTWE